MGAWNIIGLISETLGPNEHMPLHNLGLAVAIILTVLYCSDHGASMENLLKYGIELGEEIGAERQRIPGKREGFEVLARFPVQKHHN